MSISVFPLVLFFCQQLFQRLALGFPTSNLFRFSGCLGERIQKSRFSIRAETHLHFISQCNEYVVLHLIARVYCYRIHCLCEIPFLQLILKTQSRFFYCIFFIFFICVREIVYLCTRKPLVNGLLRKRISPYSLHSETGHFALNNKGYRDDELPLWRVVVYKYDTSMVEQFTELYFCYSGSPAPL